LRCILATSTPSGTLRSVRSIAIAFAFVILLLSSASAWAAAPETAADPDVSGWTGRYCTPTGCAGVASSPVSQAASFGAVSLAIILLARRRRA
jgi:hypothetical protein